MSEKQPFPAGWDDQRVRDVLAHYDGQSEDEQAVEIEPFGYPDPDEFPPPRAA